MNTHHLLINKQACLHVPKSPWEGLWVGALLGLFCLSEILLKESSPYVYFIVTKEPNRRADSRTNHHICCRDPNCTTSVLLSCPNQSFSLCQFFHRREWPPSESHLIQYFSSLFFALLLSFRWKGEGDHWAEGSIIRPKLPDWTIGPVTLQQEDRYQLEPSLSSGVGHGRQL